MYRIKIIVNGHVQGVGFRYFVLSSALKLNITGFVKNLSNGDVYIEAQGSKDNLERLISIVDEGTRFSKVSNITVDEINTIRSDNTFKVKY
ncbi:MAG: acylphosphatase [Clostridium sp.]|uniref:acylphosphatase n=1 Tax=Clostridium sp. TaxID=1506 RepID=UPI003F2BECCA